MGFWNLYCYTLFRELIRSLYTIAEGCDLEIVRALESHLKAGPCKVVIEFCVIMGIQV